MGRKGVLIGLGLGLAALLAWAWVDAGREPVRPLVEPVPVPGAVR